MFYRKGIKNVCLDILESYFYITKITGSWGLNEMNVILSNNGPKRAGLLCGVFSWPPKAFWFSTFHLEYSDEPIQDHIGYMVYYKTADQISTRVDNVENI